MKQTGCSYSARFRLGRIDTVRDCTQVWHHHHLSAQQLVRLQRSALNYSTAEWYRSAWLIQSPRGSAAPTNQPHLSLLSKHHLDCRSFWRVSPRPTDVRATFHSHEETPWQSTIEKPAFNWSRNVRTFFAAHISVWSLSYICVLLYKGPCFQHFQKTNGKWMECTRQKKWTIKDSFSFYIFIKHGGKEEGKGERENTWERIHGLFPLTLSALKEGGIAFAIHFSKT